MQTESNHNLTPSSVAAQKAGKFDKEIMAVTVKGKNGEDIVHNKDEGARD